MAFLIAFWQTGTPYWQIGLLLFVASFFMGNIMAPSLNSVLGAVPKSRAGVGSAVGNVSFQVGGALGVAALGSALSSVYQARMESALSTTLSSLPSDLAGAARESIGAAITISGKLPEKMQQSLTSLSGQSFMEGWQVVLLVICATGIAGVIVTLFFMPTGRK